MNKLPSILLLMLFLLPHFASAEIYKWTNDDGTVGFTDELGKVPEKYRDKIEIKEYEEVTPQESEVNKDSAKPEDSSIQEEATEEESQETVAEPSPEEEKPENEEKQY